MKIEFDNLFLSKIKQGIHLFLGAGFSKIESPSGKKLPDGNELCEEIIKEFKIEECTPEMRLEHVSEFCPESEYQNFLRRRFTVDDYNPIYDVLNKIAVKTIVTTNIDNLVRKVMDKSRKHYLKNIREYGATLGAANEITYIPLHGEVSDPESKLIFKNDDILTADRQNEDYFDQMYGRMVQEPILFIGYSFRDRGVVNVVNRLIKCGASDIWMQFESGDSSIPVYRMKGCHIIEGDTYQLLSWINENVADETVINNQDVLETPGFERFKIPSLTQVPAISKKEYFSEGNTEWHPILAGVPYERRIVTEIENAAIVNKNIIIIGCRFSGKTTILMQLARKIHSSCKFYVYDITKEEAKLMLRLIDKRQAYIFYENCTDDIGVYNIFARCPNITIIGTSGDYRYETAKHLLDRDITYRIFDCSEIDREEALQIYNKIPIGIRKDKFRYKASKDEKFSMFEFIANNVVGAYTRELIYHMLFELKQQDENMFKVVVLTSYMSENGSAVSYTNVARLLGIEKVHPDAVKLVDHTMSYLREYNYYITNNSGYYVLRSKLFGYGVSSVLKDRFNTDFSDVVKTFILRESRYNILGYKVFKYKAYDAKIFYALFSLKEADDLYRVLYRKNDNDPYILQQWALCYAEFKQYEKAFLIIDNAISIKPNNFSFRNSQAIISFEANKKVGTAKAIASMRQSMETLRLCYNNDKRKMYHAQIFAEFAIYFYTYYRIEDYIRDAYDWICELEREEGRIYNKRLRLAKDRLKGIIAQM